MLAILLLMSVTCPKKAEHKEVIKQALSEYVNDKTDNNVLANTIAVNVAGMFLDSSLDVDNYILFSIGTLHFNGESKPVTIGVLNQVFMINKPK